MPRDYAAEMRRWIDQEFGDGDSVPVVAHRIVDKLRADDPELLAGWLDVLATELVMDEIRRIMRSERSRARANADRGAFADAAASGDEAAMQRFLDARYVVDEENSRLPLGKMRAAHCKYVAGRYEATSKSAAMEAAFFLAIAKRIRSKTVGEVYSEQQLEDLRQSLRNV